MSLSHRDTAGDGGASWTVAQSRQCSGSPTKAACALLNGGWMGMGALLGESVPMGLPAGCLLKQSLLPSWSSALVRPMDLQSRAPSHFLPSFQHRQHSSDCSTLCPRGLKSLFFEVKKPESWLFLNQYIPAVAILVFPQAMLVLGGQRFSSPEGPTALWLEQADTSTPQPAVSPLLESPGICMKTEKATKQKYYPSNFVTELDLATTGQSNYFHDLLTSFPPPTRLTPPLSAALTTRCCQWSF